MPKTRRKTRPNKIGGSRLEAAIAKSNLTAKIVELDRVVQLHSEIVSERDFLRKLVMSLAQGNAKPQ